MEIEPGMKPGTIRQYTAHFEMWMYLSEKMDDRYTFNVPIKHGDLVLLLEVIPRHITSLEYGKIKVLHLKTNLVGWLEYGWLDYFEGKIIEAEENPT